MEIPNHGYTMVGILPRRPNFCILPFLGIFPILSLMLLIYKWQTEPQIQETNDHEAWKEETISYVRGWRWYTENKSRPWYMTGGSGGTSPERTELFASESVASDRIKEQLLYAPETKKSKLILVYNGFRTWSNIKAGDSAFSACPVKDCMLTANKAKAVKADAILFNELFLNPEIVRPRDQIWILYMVESPFRYQNIKEKDVFNWTASYRWDSDIVEPYDKWVMYDKDVIFRTVRRNFALNKTKKVAWFVSECSAWNNRLQYAQELRKHIEVDIYGKCGEKKCPRNDVIPIVMGAKPEEYARSAPLGSYIHVDEFESPKALADYLHVLDNDPDLYNAYFRWRGTGEFINTRFFCRMCALLHGNFPEKSYNDINAWLKGLGVCTASSWKKHKSNWEGNGVVKKKLN